MASEQGTNNNISNITPTPTTTREYRKGNWTIQESMILIEAKKMDDERRMKRNTIDDHHEMIGVGGSSNSGALRSVISSNKPTELRWKWVEDYCWKRGCYRSQNQCNDKWDNLMRDYKKIRDYLNNNNNNAAQKLVCGTDNVNVDNVDITEKRCYWNMEKFERKAKNLPSNMLQQIYDALVEVVEKKGVPSSSGIGGGVHNRVMQLGCSSGSGGSGGGGSIGGPIMQPVTMCLPLPQPQLPVQTPISSPASVAPALPVVAPTQTPILPLAFVPLPTHPIRDDGNGSSSEPDTSEYSEPAHGQAQAATAARRESSNKKKRPKGGAADDESEITKSATMIAQAIQAREERVEKRHKQILILHEKRLKIEESKIIAINNLANSLLALAHNQTPPST